MAQKFPTGKILVHYANYGAMDPSPKQTFWAKSYGESPNVEVGDIITIRIGRETTDAMWNGRPPMLEKWRVSKVKENSRWRGEWTTYFERIE